jgi:hypothetical protein
MINYSDRELIVHNFDHASEIRIYIGEDLVGTIYLEDGRWGPSGVESSGSKREAIASLLHWHGLDCPNIMHQLDNLVPQGEEIAELEQIDRTAGDGSAPDSNPENKIVTVLLKKEENDVIEIYLEMKTRNAYAGLIRKRRDTYPWDGFNSNSIEITSNWATRLEAIQSLLAKSHAWEDRFKVTIEEQLNAFSQPQPQRRSLDFATAEPRQAIVIEFSGNEQIKDQSIKTTICSVHSEGGEHTALIDLKGITLSCHRSGGWARLSNNMRVFEEDGLVLLTGDVKTEDGKEELDFQCNVYPL